jgi:periplasmic divalent cation tolerance protein
MADIRLLFVTAPPERAEEIVHALAAERLVACGNVISGVKSIYWWQGELCKEDEAVLLMETAADCVDAAVARLRELHPYSVPKIVVIDPASVNADYVRWAIDETRAR